MDEELNLLAARHDRIATRRAKAQARLLELICAEHPGTGEAAATNQKEDLSVAATHLLSSKGVISEEHSRALEELHKVQTAEEQLNLEYATKDRHVRQNLLADRLREAERIVAAEAERAKKWSELQNISVPLELQAAMLAQQQDCTLQQADIDKLAAKIWDTLEGKDKDYVKTLQRHSVEIDELLQLLAQQTAAFEATCVEQLEALEAAFLQEGQLHKAEYHTKVEKRIQEQSFAEQNFLQKYVQTLHEYQAQLQEVRKGDMESFRELKLRMKGEVQDLERYLEAMKATYLLNHEKLVYNGSVLEERGAETQATIVQQKRRLARQREALVKLKQKYLETEKKYADENTKLLEEYKGLVESINHQQEKQCNFHSKNAHTFKEVQILKQGQRDRLAGRLAELHCLATSGMTQKLPVGKTGDSHYSLMDPSNNVDASDDEESCWLALHQCMEDYLLLMRALADCEQQVQHLRTAKDSALEGMQ